MTELCIWVCFKVQPDFNHVLESDWEGFGPDSDIGYAQHGINCFDESSLELALRLKEDLRGSGREAKLGAITLASSLQSSIQRSLFAAGYDEILRIDARMEFSPAETGRLLAAHLAARSPDWVFFGKQAGWGDTGLVPYYTAHRLGYPLLTDAENILDVETPCAVITGNSPAVLRISPLSRQLAVKHMRAEVARCETPAIAPPVLIRNKQWRSVKILEPDALPGLITKLLHAKQAALEQSAFTAPGHVILAEPGEADAAIRYASERNLPCVTGVIGMSADGKTVMRKCCGSHMEWRIPVGEQKQVWVISPALRPVPGAKLLLAGGRGMGERGMQTLRRLASLLGGQAGVTRAAAQNGWDAMDRIVGQSGIIARPESCVIFGASGAAAFMAGIEQSRTIIAVNTDPDAPIFGCADYGVIADAAKTADMLLEAFA